MNHETRDTSKGVSRRTLIKTAGAGLATAGLGLSGAIGSAAAAVPTPPLETDENAIVDPSGNVVRPRGFAIASVDYVGRDWYSYPLTPQHGSGLSILEWATSGEMGWYPNHIRLPVTSDAITADVWDLETVVEEYLRPAVEYLKIRGQYALVDFHLIRPYNEQGFEEDDDEYTHTADEIMEIFWPMVAEEFAEDDNVIFELFNEPTLPAGWGEEDATIWNMWQEAAQPWVDMVQEHAPARPLVIGSPSWTSYPHMAAEAKTNSSVNAFSGENLIYAGHIYPANGLPYEEQNDSGPFDETYGQPAEEVPVWITEFGWDPKGGSVDQGTTSGFGEAFRDWISEDYDTIGWSAWCFDDTWAPTFFDSEGEGHGSDWELKDDSDQEAGFIKSWLESTRDEQNPEPTGEDTEAPPSPSPVSVEDVSEISATVSWSSVSDDGSGLSHFDVYVDDERRTQAFPDTTSATVDGLEPATSYEVSVEAVDGARNASDRASTSVTTLARDEGQSAYRTHEVPCRIDLEAYDEGGQGISYFDTDPENQGNSTARDGGVDIAETSDGNDYVTYVEADEWLEYTLDVPATSTYPVRLRFAGTANPAATVRIEIDGEERISGSGWQTDEWTTFEDTGIGDLDLEAGEHILRLHVEEAGSNLDWLQIGDPEDPPETTETTPEKPTWPENATDPDDDGLYEDLSGNGEIDFPDVNALFQSADSSQVQDNTRFYDFSGDDAVDLQDVLALFDMV